MISSKQLLRVSSLFCVFLFLGIVFSTQSVANPIVNHQPTQTSFMYISGHGTWIGSSEPTHLTPLWLLDGDGWVSFSFDKATVILVNGAPQLITEEVRIYMEGFRGFAPGTLWWLAQSSLGLRARIFGVCSYYEIHE